MAEVGHAALGIYPSFDGFHSKLERGTSPHLVRAGASGGTKFGDAMGESAGRRFSSKFQTLAKAGALAALAGVAVAGKVIGDSIQAAADLGETASKTAQIFGDEALPALEKFAAGASKSLGQSRQSALDAISTFGVFGKAAGLQGPKLAKFSTKLTTLASDMASFGNTSPEEAIEAIGSALRGEAEPMRKYGVLLDDATLKAEALALGILKPVKDEAKIKAYYSRVIVAQDAFNKAVAEFGKGSVEAIKAQGTLGTAQSGLAKATEGTIPPLTTQQKVLAANAAIYKQTSDQQGDFARTSDGLANKQRILNAEWDNAKVKLGTVFLPLATRAAGFLVDKLIPGIERAASFLREKFGPAFAAIGGAIQRALPALRDFGEKVLGGISQAWANFRDETKDNGAFLRAVGDGLAKIGAVMLDKVLPALGTFASVTIPTAGKVLGKFVGVLQTTAEATLLIGEYGAKSFRALLNAAFTSFDGIVSAAAKGMGWIPGIGEKIKGANKAFDQFRDSTISKLDAIAREARNLRELLTAPATMPLSVKYLGTAMPKNALGESGDPRFGGARAMGGPVDPSRYYKVGERGPEYFQPSVPGRIVTQAPAGSGGPTVTIGQVVAHDYNDFLRQAQRRVRATNGGGVNF